MGFNPPLLESGLHFVSWLQQIGHTEMKAHHFRNWVIKRLQLPSWGLLLQSLTLGETNCLFLRTLRQPCGEALVRNWGQEPREGASSDDKVKASNGAASADILLTPYERLWARRTQLSYSWILDPLKLWDNKCLLQATTFWGNSLHSNRQLIPCACQSLWFLEIGQIN